MTKLKLYLTPKQFAFTSAYIENGFNATQAAISAGYSKHYAISKASDLLSQPVIKKRIETAFQRSEDKLGITWDWKLRKLKRVVNAFIPDDESLKLETMKVKTGLTALAELNKMSGDYAPDKRISMTVDATQDKLTQALLSYSEF